MRRIGSPVSNRLTASTSRAKVNGAANRAAPMSLLVLLRLTHDFLRGEVDVAGREGIADKEVVGLGRVVVFAVLEVGILGGRERQLDRLRYDLPLERGDRDLDRDCDLGRTGAAGRAHQALARQFGAEFAETVLGLAAER